MSVIVCEILSIPLCVTIEKIYKQGGEFWFNHPLFKVLLESDSRHNTFIV